MKTIPFNPAWLDGFIWQDKNWRFTPKNDVAAIVGLCRGISGNIVEVGCNAGVTTRNLALNMPTKLIYAVDYIGHERTMIADQAGENPERGIFSEAEHLQNVVCIHSKGENVNYEALCEVGTVFIDGDHTYEGVEKDTNKLIDFPGIRLRKDLILLIWNDCSENETWSGVFKFLSELEKETGMEINRIEGSTLAFAYLW